MSTSTTHRVYSSKAWQVVRQACLVRDGYMCRIRLPGCTRTATQADHIQELGEGGAPFDLANTQAACRHCNVAKENNRRLGVTPTSDSPPSRDW